MAKMMNVSGIVEIALGENSDRREVGNAVGIAAKTKLGDAFSSFRNRDGKVSVTIDGTSEARYVKVAEFLELVGQAVESNNARFTQVLIDMNGDFNDRRRYALESGRVVFYPHLAA